MYDDLIIFDGHCPFCHFWVKRLLWADRKAKFRFLSSQSEQAEGLLRPFGIEAVAGDIPESVITLTGGEAYQKSEAVIMALGRIGGIWRIAAILRIIPLRWRDAFYEWVGRQRYRWFGTYETCPLPPERYRERFL